jgi:peptidoglycan/LPS O-acetylase OafA/YrhL
VAVIVVLLYHAQIKWFSGGFIGVDVFFTISGYVVALSILRSLDQGDFRLRDFYARRLRRLAPSLYLVLAATLVFCASYCFPQDTYGVLKNSLLASVFYSNIYLAKQTGYFSADADQQALLHTWSLSVEEQFYLVFPLALLALRKMRPAMLLAIAGGACVLGLIWSQTAVAAGTPQAYFKLQYRLFEFLAGIVIAVLQRLRGPQRAHLLRDLLPDLLLVTGLALIGYAVIHFDAQTAMPGWHAAIPCTGAALILAAGRGAKLAHRLLANAMLVYLGKLSYVIYLWHWPVMFAFRRLQFVSTAAMVAAIALSLLLGALTHHYWEQPLRQARWSVRQTFFRLFVAPVIVMGCLLATANRYDNFSRLYPEAYRLNYEATGSSVFDTARAKKCWGKVAVTSPQDCSVGDMAIPVNAVFWGDSHAYHLIDFMDQLGKKHGQRLHDLTMTMCPPNADGPARAGDPFYQKYRDECRQHNRAVMSYILSNDAIKTVVMSAVWANYDNPGRGTDVQPTPHGYLPGDAYLAATLARLSAANKRVIFVDDIPIVPPDLDNCLSNRLYLPTARDTDCTYDESYAIAQHQPAVKILAEMTQLYPDTAIIHTYDVPCSAGRCATQLLGVPLYRNNDTGHLGSGGSRVYYEAYRQRRGDELQRIFGAN